MLAAALVLTLLVLGCSSAETSTVGSQLGAPSSASGSGDAVLAQAFAAHAEGVEVEGTGIVARLLADDTEGDQHQRFIVELASGQTLLIAHNIDVAPRVEPLEVGDTVSFKGEYVWNDEGGVIHWTHHDPDGMHEAGWIEHEGRTYQ